MHGDGGGDDRVHDAFRNFFGFAVSCRVGDGRVGHQVADIAQKHQ